MKIIIFCVNYNTYDLLRTYLSSLDKSCYNTKTICDVIVIDNSSKKRVIDYTPINFRLKVKKESKNLGYFPSIRKEMLSVENINSYDFIILSNVDMLFENNTICDLAKLQIEGDIGWIAPQIYSKTLNKDLNPQAIKRYSLKKIKILRFAFKYPIIHFIYARTLHKLKRHSRSKSPKGIYAGHGSFIILTKRYIEECGALDFPNFLYGEEIFLAEECRLHHLKVLYLPKIKVIDIGRASTGKLKSRDYYRYNYNGLNYLINRYYTI